MMQYKAVCVWYPPMPTWSGIFSSNVTAKEQTLSAEEALTYRNLCLSNAMGRWEHGGTKVTGC